MGSCLALWKIILVGTMLGFVTCAPAPPPLLPAASGEEGAPTAVEPKTLLTTTGGEGGTAPAPEGDLTPASTFGFGYGLGLGSLYGGYYPYAGGYNRGFYGGGGYYGGGYNRGFGYGYPSYYGSFW